MRVLLMLRPRDAAVGMRPVACCHLGTATDETHSAGWDAENTASEARPGRQPPARPPAVAPRTTPRRAGSV